MISCSDFKTTEMQVFVHHVYEYKKGLRNLVLHTMPSAERHKAESYLLRKNIPYLIQNVTEAKVNIFFGNKECVNVVEGFNRTSLNDFTDEEDFILGIMLGYDRLKQCERYLGKKNQIRELIIS